MDGPQDAAEGVTRFVALVSWGDVRPPLVLRLVADGVDGESESLWAPAARRWEYSHFVQDDRFGHCDDNLVDITRERALELQESWRIHLGQDGPPDRT